MFWRAVGLSGFLFCGARARWPLFFCGARKCALSNLLHSHSNAPLLQGHLQRNFSQFLRYLRTKPSGERAPTNTFSGPIKKAPFLLQIRFWFSHAVYPPHPPPIASLQQLPALFQRFPSSVPPPPHPPTPPPHPPFSPTGKLPSVWNAFRNLQMWRCEDVDQQMWGCEDVDQQMWGYEM